MNDAKCQKVSGGDKNCAKLRIDYIDLLKGLTMFGVVWFHSIGHPEWLTAMLVNSTFFFLSGMFFKRESFPVFLRKKAKALLVPFVVFYLLCYPYKIMVHYWDFRTLAGFDWGCIFDLFDIVGRWDYLSLNVPLWFLLCLFVVQLIYYGLSKCNKWLVVVVVLLTMAGKEFINSIPTPFMINNACYWIGFFAAGNLCGCFLMEQMKDLRRRLAWLICSVAVVAVLTWQGNHWTDEYYIGLTYQLKLYAVFCLLFAAGSFFDGWKVLKPVRFLGLNTLAMLCMHVPVLIVFGRIASKLSGHHPTPFLGFICALLTCFVCYFAIIFCNRYCPVIVGKSARVASSEK